MSLNTNNLTDEECDSLYPAPYIKQPFISETIKEKEDQEGLALKKAEPIEETALDIPNLIRQTTSMVVNGIWMYNGCSSGERLLSKNNEYDLPE